jgi:hypothetical protein
VEIHFNILQTVPYNCGTSKANHHSPIMDLCSTPTSPAVSQVMTRTRRNSKPTERYTPSRNLNTSTHTRPTKQKEYTLNRGNALAKKAAACEKEPIITIPRAGCNISYELNTAAYEIMRQTVVPTLQHKGLHCTTEQIEDNDNLIVQETIRVTKTEGQKDKFQYTINMHHTTCYITVNGEEFNRFDTEVMPIITKQIEQQKDLSAINNKIKRHCDSQAQHLPNDPSQVQQESNKNRKMRTSTRTTQQASLKANSSPVTQQQLSPPAAITTQTPSTSTPQGNQPPRSNTTNLAICHDNDQEDTPTICPTCSQPAIDECIQCTSCCFWFHHECELLEDWEIEHHIDNVDEIYHCSTCRQIEKDRQDVNNTSIYSTPTPTANQGPVTPPTLQIDVQASPPNPQKGRPVQANKKVTVASGTPSDQRADGHIGNIPDKENILKEREKDLADREKDHRQRERRLKATEKKLVGKENELANNPRQLATAQSYINKLEADNTELRESARIRNSQPNNDYRTHHSPPNIGGYAPCNSGPCHHHNSYTDHSTPPIVSSQLQQLSI